MVTTGLSFTKEFDRRTDKSFNDYYAPSVLKRFFRRAVQLAITDKYNNFDNQKRNDELRSFLVYKKSVGATSGRIMLQPIAVIGYDDTTGVITTAYPHNALVAQTISVSIVGATGSYIGDVVVSAVTETTITIPTGVTTGAFVSGEVVTPESLTDYMHLFAIRASYRFAGEDDIKAITCSPQSIYIHLTNRSKLRDKEQIIVADVVGATGANGVKYVRQAGNRKYQLFEDKDLLVPTVATSAYLSGGTISTVRENACFPIKPDIEYIQKVDKPSKSFPRYQIADNALILEPATDSVSARVDYIKLPFEIDPEDDTINLNLYISEEMIQYILDYAARLFDLETKDINSLQIDTQQVVINQ